MNLSEVARLRQQIELECQAMLAGLNGYAATARHEIIMNRFKSLGKHQEQLEALVGPEEAERVVVETYNQVMG